MSGGWNTIESDAGVFTYLLSNLGVRNIQFEEILSLDPSFLAPLGPLHGVIFLFKYPTDTPYTNSSSPLDGQFDQDCVDDVFFARQVIENACATQALLSLVLNKTEKLEIGGDLREFREFAMSLPSDLRGEVLSNSDHIRTVHNSFAKASPFINEVQNDHGKPEDAFHFIAYTSINGTLYELDGLQPYPISHGACTTDDLAEKVMPVLHRRVARYEDGEIRFNLLALVEDQRKRAEDFGNTDMLEMEEVKRRQWLFENSLRRHNFVAFSGEMLKEVVRAKDSTGEYDKWIKDGDAAEKQDRQRRQE